ncbi:hypothetical protein EWM64_g4929 [Hericium alpestre]|uniref:NAD-dependent epimerase/dehydratase domain-containing protein n=1 Tax=Hericium alpestre TaxID=135208 RepID=A0A4Y9ZZX6_9AGAM|nr:hypothetical protein EWM64_g4929 [Hericium alpestre]
MSHIRTVLVTGASGFTGSAIVDQLLAAGYTVRGYAIYRVKAAYGSFGDKFEVAVVDDIVTSDLTDAFKGVDVLIHAGSPLNPPGTTDVVIKNAVDGTINVLNFALKARVKKIVFTSSLITIADVPDMMSNKTFTGEDWNGQTVEDALKADAPMWAAYGASKTASEKALWKFATDPEVDVTTIHPAFLYGPAGHGQVLDAPVTGTNSYIYQLISGEKGRAVPDQMSAGIFTDVRDAAQAHVLALRAPPADEPKRIIVLSGDFTWKDAVAYLHAARSDLKDRLPALSVGDTPAAAANWCRWDTSSAEKVLGIKEYKDWKTTLTETIDDVITREKKLASVIAR